MDYFVFGNPHPEERRLEKVFRPGIWLAEHEPQLFLSITPIHFGISLQDLRFKRARAEELTRQGYRILTSRLASLIFSDGRPCAPV